jgi:hypothetical protein
LITASVTPSIGLKLVPDFSAYFLAKFHIRSTFFSLGSGVIFELGSKFGKYREYLVETFYKPNGPP